MLYYPKKEKIMKLVNFELNGNQRLGAWVGTKVYDLNAGYELYLRQTSSAEKSRQMAANTLPPNMVYFLKLGDTAIEAAQKTIQYLDGLSGKQKKAVYNFGDVSLKASVLNPPKLLCIGDNYYEHLAEFGEKPSERQKSAPYFFMKPPSTTVIGPGQPIVIAKNSNKIDWEGELAVVIGKRGKYIAEAQAYEYVAGYTCFNDISEREIAIMGSETDETPFGQFINWLNGKWMDTAAPMGPCLVLKDEIEEPHNLRLTLRLNGKIMQDAKTNDMITRIPEMIAFISAVMTLEPGDVIATGTPSGVGASSGTFLRDGDEIELEIEKIGILRNPVVAESTIS